MLPVSHSARSLVAIERLQRELGLPCGADFDTARMLIALVESVAPSLNDIDRTQISRLLYGAAHAITQLDRK